MSWKPKKTRDIKGPSITPGTSSTSSLFCKPIYTHTNEILSDDKNITKEQREYEKFHSFLKGGNMFLTFSL